MGLEGKVLKLVKKVLISIYHLRVAAAASEAEKNCIWIWIEVPLPSFLIIHDSSSVCRRRRIWSLCFSWEMLMFEQKKSEYILNIILKSRDVREQITWHLAAFAWNRQSWNHVLPRFLHAQVSAWNFCTAARQWLVVKFNKFSFTRS